MPAQTADGTHIITVGELLEMLSQCDPHDRIRMEGQPIDRVSRCIDGTWDVKMALAENEYCTVNSIVLHGDDEDDE